MADRLSHKTIPFHSASKLDFKNQSFAQLLPLENVTNSRQKTYFPKQIFLAVSDINEPKTSHCF